MKKRTNNNKNIHFAMNKEIIEELDNIRTNYNIKTGYKLSRTTLINYICSVFVDDFLNNEDNLDKTIISLFLNINEYKGVIE